MSSSRETTGRPILLLDGHSVAAVETLQALGRLGLAVHVASEAPQPLAFLSRYCRSRLSQPQAGDRDSFLKWLEQLHAAHDYALIVPTTENSLVVLNGLADGHVLRGLALLPAAASVNVALSKQATWELAERLNVRVPRSRLITSPDDVAAPASYPTVLKPVRSMVELDGRVVRLEALVARDSRERQGYLRRFIRATPIQEQEYVSGTGVGVECLYDHGRLAWYFVHERLHELPLTGGGSTYRRSIAPSAQAVIAARRILDALDWHGVAMVEFKRDPRGDLYLMEINPRLWGSLALAIDAGVNFPLGMWKLACRQRLGPQPRYRVPYFTRRLAGDLDWMKDNLRADHGDPLLLTKPRMRSVMELLRPMLLVESWDYFDIRDWRVIRRHVAEVISQNWSSARGLLARWRRRRALQARHRQFVRRVRSGALRVDRILFICYGNICRSAFAEVYARAKLPRHAVSSAGFHDVDGRSSPPHLVRAASELGVDLSAWRSRRVTATLIAETDLVLVMDDDNYRMLADRYPAAAERAIALGLFSEPQRFPIEDPYRLADEETRSVLESLRSSIDALAHLLGSPACSSEEASAAAGPR